MERLLIGHAARCLLALLCVVPNGQGQRLLNRRTQRLYVENDQAFKAAQPLPLKIVRVLLRSTMSEAGVKELLKITPEPGRPGTLFSAVPVRLGPIGARWLLAVGTSPATSGADNGHFWLVNLSDSTPRAVLLAPADHIKLLKTTHAGHSDVETEWCSPNLCMYGEYGFIRGAYRRFRERETANVEPANPN